MKCKTCGHKDRLGATKKLKFDKIKDRLLKILDEKQHELGIEENFTLLDGIFDHRFQMELSNSLEIGGPIVPTIYLLGKKTGRLYPLALKALTKDCDDYWEKC